MKYLRQIGVILFVSFIAELVRLLIPAPIPASIYGLIILFLCLQFRIVKLESIEETGNFLLTIMPLLFVPPTVGLIDKWQCLSSIAAPALAHDPPFHCKAVPFQILLIALLYLHY